MTRKICAALAALLTGPFGSVALAEPIEAVVSAIRVGVTNLVESSSFYREHLGFEMLFDASEDGYIVLDNHGVMLVLTPSEAAVEIADDACFVAINFRTDDLDETVASLKAGAVQVVGEGESAVGRAVKFLDPSGNLLHMKELFYEHPDGPAGDSPRVYNLGIRVTDIDAGLEFYEGLLGFEPLTRDYYPPVIPLKQKGNVSFILSESAGEPAPYDHRRVAFAGMAFEVRDVPAALAELKRRGARLLDEHPSRAGNVIHAAFVDPFGNVHEVIQHVASDAALVEEHTEESEMTSLEDLSWMSGVWRGGSGSDVIEETWSGPEGDAMIGMFRWTRDGHTWLYELMAVEQNEDGVRFLLRHFSRGVEPWASEADGALSYPLKSIGDREVVFENPDLSDERPLRFIYRREGESLVIRIEGRSGSADEFRLEGGS